MTPDLLEALRSGAVRVVPGNPSTQQKDAGGIVCGSRDIAHEMYNQMIAASPDHTADLVALIEGLSARAAKAEEQRASIAAEMVRQLWEEKARATEVEEELRKERDALRDQLTQTRVNLVTADETIVSLREDANALREALAAETEACAQTALTCLVEAAASEGHDFQLGAHAGRSAACAAIRARALTQDQPNVGE